MKAALSAGEAAEAAVTKWLPRIDDMFIPTLASRIDAATANQDAELQELLALMQALQSQTQTRFERARDQLQTLLGAGEVNKMDAQLSGLVRRNELDAGFLYVLFQNMRDAQSSDDEGTYRVLAHIHTRVQEELEKRTAPALALLHKLTRTDDAPLRGRILRYYMLPQSSVRLPDGTELPMEEEKPAQVSPEAFAGAVEETLNKVLAMPLDRSLIMSTVESVRQVAKEAREVVAESYSAEVLDAFSDALTPVFARAPRPE